MSSMYGNSQVDRSHTNLPLTETVETTESADSSSTTSVKEMEAYLRKEFADRPILVDIARCESNFQQFDKDGKLIRGRVDNADVGVMQINERYHADMAKKLGIDIYTVEGNVHYAKHLYDELGSKPWNASSKCWLGNQVAKSDGAAK